MPKRALPLLLILLSAVGLLPSRLWAATAPVYRSDLPGQSVAVYGVRGDPALDARPKLAGMDSLLTSGGTRFYPRGTYKIGTNYTSPANWSSEFENGATLKPAAGVTLTLLGPISAGPRRIFDVSASGATISFAGNTRIEKVYPDWFGATGNGVADDTAAFQAAATASAGRTLYLPAGSVYIVDEITLPPSGITITGGGTVKFKEDTAATSLLKAEYAANVVIDGITFDGNYVYARPTTGSISASSATLTVQSAAMLTVGLHVLVAGAALNNAPLEATITGVSGTTISLNIQASKTVQNAQVYLVHQTVWSQHRHGVLFRSVKTSKVINCHFVDLIGDGVMISNSDTPAAATAGATVGSFSLTVDSTARFSSGDRIGVRGAGTAGATLWTQITGIKSGTQLILNDALETDPGDNYVDLPSQNIPVQQNHFVGDCLNRNGVSIIAGTNLSISQNTFAGMSRSLMPGAIDVEPDLATEIADTIGITGNSIAGCPESMTRDQRGIVAQSAPNSALIRNLTISNNTISGPLLAGIYVGGHDADQETVTISGNTIRDVVTPYNIATPTGHGIYVSSMRATISGNTVDTAATQALNLIGSNVVVVDNILRRGYSYGILMNSGSGILANNQIYDAGYGIAAAYGGLASSERSGIHLNASDVQVLDNRIETSDPTWTANGIFQSGGSGVIYRGNTFKGVGRNFNTSGLQRWGVNYPDGTATNASVFGAGSDAAPTTGTWAKGTLLFNPTPTAGQPWGWLCTVTGTPGTWQALGQNNFNDVLTNGATSALPITVGKITTSPTISGTGFQSGFVSHPTVTSTNGSPVGWDLSATLKPADGQPAYGGYLAGVIDTTAATTVPGVYGWRIDPFTKTGTGTIGDFFGFWSNTQTIGTRNWSIGSAGHTWIGGKLAIGTPGTSLPTNDIEINGNVARQIGMTRAASGNGAIFGMQAGGAAAGAANANGGNLGLLSGISVGSGTSAVNISTPEPNSGGSATTDNNYVTRVAIDYTGAFFTVPVVIGSGTSIKKVVVYTPSLTPSSVAANTSAEQTFTVAGLTSADTIVAFNPPGLTAGTGIMGVRVSGADTLAVTFGNMTSGSLTPASGVYKIIAVRS